VKSKDAKNRPIEILLVEDNPGDVKLVTTALRKAGVRHRLTVAPDGRAALDALGRRGAFADAPRPDIILLDLNLPHLSGHEVLAFIKGHEEFRRIPVVIMTSSQLDDDVLRSYDLHANSYVTKPGDLTAFLEVVRSVEQFWLHTAELPPEE